MTYIVTATLAQMWENEQPQRGLLADELLSGHLAVECLDTLGGVPPDRVRCTADHRYSGWVCRHDLCADSKKADRWNSLPKLVITASCVDVQQQPQARSLVVKTLLRGSLVTPCGTPVDDWQPVTTADDLHGYLRINHVAPYPMGQGLTKQQLRKSLVDTGLSYLGCCYRWGGKTSLGIDCSGLVSQCYLMHGITLWRDAAIKEGFAARAITREQLQPADLLYWKGHVALYLGGQRYLHANASFGGVCINSLAPNAPDCRRDLMDTLTAFGTAL